jgi:hypothetical protein
MKIIYYGLLLFITCILNVAYAEIINEELSKTNRKFETHLQQGDILIVKYDLSRGPMTREKEWEYYAIFCYTHGKAQMEYTINNEGKIHKLPALMSKEEHNQEDIATNIDSKGVLKISNLSVFYSGTIVSCGLYPKFGE